MDPRPDDFKTEPRPLDAEALAAAPSSLAGRARDLLRRLRDLDLGARIAVGPGRFVRLEGCDSRDEPVERGVRYRLRTASGCEETLSLACDGEVLEVQLTDGPRWRRLRSPLRCDALGRLAAPELGARLAGPSAPRGVACPLAAGRFLRRVVRALYG